MGCPLGLDRLHCPTCQFNSCDYQKIKLIKRLDQNYKDRHGNIYVDFVEWNSIKQEANCPGQGMVYRLEKVSILCRAYL
jgi:hypothetical protein